MGASAGGFMSRRYDSKHEEDAIPHPPKVVLVENGFWIPNLTLTLTITLNLILNLTLNLTSVISK